MHRCVIIAKRGGIVEYVSSEKIIIRADEDQNLKILMIGFLKELIPIICENFNVQVIAPGFTKLLL